MRRTRRLFVVLCILAVLAAALLAPATGGSPALAILVPLAPLFGLVVVPDAPANDPVPDYTHIAPAPGPSRAPPAVA